MKTASEILAFCREGKLIMEECIRFATIELKNVSIDKAIPKRHIKTANDQLEILNKILEFGESDE